MGRGLQAHLPSGGRVGSWPIRHSTACTKEDLSYLRVPSAPCSSYLIRQAPGHNAPLDQSSHLYLTRSNPFEVGLGCGCLLDGHEPWRLLLELLPGLPVAVEEEGQVIGEPQEPLLPHRHGPHAEKTLRERAPGQNGPVVSQNSSDTHVALPVALISW
jgi:hypothetical protein